MARLKGNHMREGSGVSPAVTALFASVLQRVQGPLRGFVLGLVGSPEQADDIVQDVFVDAWRTARRAAAPFQGDGDEPAIRRWLFHVAYRRAISVLRHHAVLSFESLDVTPAPQPHSFYEPVPFDDQLAEGEILRTALAGLGPQDAACLLLNVVQGFTAMEIASMLDLGPLAAKRRLSRAKHRLRNAYFVESVEQRTGVQR
jgi:RNA polymerase sigma-70 factor, ECF subfamily